MGITEGERGFEQTKECYLTEVIPFFKTLKEHFEGIQKALTKEVKEMKEIFEELEDEVDQNVVNRKYDEIEQKNLLIANDNLIDDCLSEDVFYIATNYELTLKYQNLKERFGNNTSPPARDALDFDSVFIIEKMKASIQGKDNAIKKLRMQISQLNETRSETGHTLDFRALDFQITQLTDKVTVLQEQNEIFRTENAKIKQHYKELYDSIKITRQIHENLKCITMDSVKPRVLATGRYAIDVEPIPPRNRNNREVHLDYLKHLKESVETLREIVEKAKVERPIDSSLAFACLYTKHSQELLEYVIGTCLKDFNQRDKNHAATPLTRKKLLLWRTNVKRPKIVLWYLDSGCSKHMTGDRSRLRNFMKKFIGTTRFGNDHFGAIIGYGDYVIGDSVISRVYYVEGLGHNLFSVRQFCDFDLEVAFRKHSCYV
ncbi:hypothetical protein Tco_1541249 [Tanacetum coccineum]